MYNKEVFSWDRFYKAPVVGILRGIEGSVVREIAGVYLECGFHTLEITMNTEQAEEIIGVLRKEFSELNVGAGTVCSHDDLHLALQAGAQFIVTPVIREEVIRACVQKDIPVFPGAFTPTEIYNAWALGASAVKVFPATQLGPAYMKDVMAPLDEVKLLPTGGIGKDNIRAYFEAGVIGVGMGSSLFPKALVEKGDFKGLGEHLLAIKALLKSN